MRYAFKRKTFGKLLIEHPVIRLKLAHMARQVEATWAQLENITYQMSVMTFKEQMATLGGPIALCKAQSTTVFEYCAREAAQIFGGLAYTRGGQGEKVERLYREVRAYAIPGGSEEIMVTTAGLAPTSTSHRPILQSSRTPRMKNRDTDQIPTSLPLSTFASTFILLTSSLLCPVSLLVRFVSVLFLFLLLCLCLLCLSLPPSLSLSLCSWTSAFDRRSSPMQ